MRGGGDVGAKLRKLANDMVVAGEIARRQAIDNIHIFGQQDIFYCEGHTRIEKDGRTSWRLIVREPEMRGGQLRSWGWSESEVRSRMYQGLALYFSAQDQRKSWAECLNRAAESSVRIMGWTKT